MSVILKNGKPAPEEALKKLEAELGCKLSPSFRHFVGENDGSEPETNIFKITESNDSGVNRFIPVSQILNERRRIENSPSKAYPIAWAEGGNYVLLDEGSGGRVFFWDHEGPDVIELAKDFDAFLLMLKPFDVQSIELKPGQVKEAWINPELLKRFKK